MTPPDKAQLPNVFLDSFLKKSLRAPWTYCFFERDANISSSYDVEKVAAARIEYIPKAKLDRAIVALKEISHHNDDWGNGCTSLTNAAKIARECLKEITNE